MIYPILNENNNKISRNNSATLEIDEIMTICNESPVNKNILEHTEKETHTLK